MTMTTAPPPQGQSFIERVNHQFLTPISNTHLLSLSSALHKSYVLAASKSPSQMLPSHITTLPSGRERGQYLAVDLGGTNMRVALVRLQDNEATVEKLDKSTIPEQVKTGTAQQFFRWIAQRIVALAEQCHLDDGEDSWKLGVTWSFPFAQNAVNKGTIHQMGKGFNIPSILNASLTDLLHDALEDLRPAHPIHVTALLNDAVATLLSHAFIRPNTRMGLICGTGTNATCLCPTEYLSDEKYHHADAAGGARAWEEFVLVNTEWSMFGKGLLPVTEYDGIVDQESGMPGFQPFEQMVSGRYIGEIVRLVCLDGIKQHAWSFDTIPQGWDCKWTVQTATCSTVEANYTNTMATINLLNKLHPLESGSYTHSDAELFRRICMAVSTRSASLVAASTIALLKVNNELCKSPPPNGGTWPCGSASSGTPSPSDSGLGSMDEDIRWSRRGSLFSAQGSRRGSLASPTLLSVQPPVPTAGRPGLASGFPSPQVLPEGMVMELRREEGGRGGTLVMENGIVVEEPMHLSEEEDDGEEEEDDGTVVVAFCGSVMEKYHNFRTRCQNILDELVQQPCPDSGKTPNGMVNKVNGATTEVGGGGMPRLKNMGVMEQRRVVLEENGDGGILGAGILAAVMDTKEITASIVAHKQ